MTHPQPRSTLASRLRSERIAAGMTLRALGKMAGVSHSHIALIEAGGRDITLAVCLRLARALRCDPEWLAGWD